MSELEKLEFDKGAKWTLFSSLSARSGLLILSDLYNSTAPICWTRSVETVPELHMCIYSIYCCPLLLSLLNTYFPPLTYYHLPY